MITKNNKPTNDPFVEPFTPGAYIDEVTDTHFLIFNKYSVCERHVILATKEFERQLDPLTQEDFKATCMVMKSTNSFVFFNRGFNSGASIMHKHLQLIPYETMDTGEYIPVEKCAL